MAHAPGVTRKDAKVSFDDAATISDLMREGGLTFSVKDQFDLDGADYERPEDVFDPESLITCANFNTLDLEDHSGMPFEAIKEKMTNVTPDGNIKKRVLREGIGEIIPPDSLVRIHYDAYFEYSEVPFDSTTLRGEVCEFLVGTSNLIGLNFAVASMREKEKAEFIFHPSVAYGAKGCPPRIPGNVEVLFTIELVRSKTGSEAAVARATTNAWVDVKVAVKELIKEAISSFNEQRFKDSKYKLEKAKRLLEQCHLKDDEEEADKKECLFKVSLNLAMALNKLPASFADSAVSNCKEALHIHRDNPKAHLQLGIALITLGDLKEAREHLAKADKKLPGDRAVLKAWEMLEIKKKHEREEESSFWKKSFNSTEKTTDKHEELSPEVTEIFNYLKEFASNPSEISLTLPGGMTPMEEAEVGKLAQLLNLNLELRDKSILITKPKK